MVSDNRNNPITTVMMMVPVTETSPCQLLLDSKRWKAYSQGKDQESIPGEAVLKRGSKERRCFQGRSLEQPRRHEDRGGSVAGGGRRGHKDGPGLDYGVFFSSANVQRP